MLKILTNNGHEVFIEDEDLVHYVDAEVLERVTDPDDEVVAEEE